jgi:hypothetical protein
MLGRRARMTLMTRVTVFQELDHGEHGENSALLGENEAPRALAASWLSGVCVIPVICVRTRMNTRFPGRCWRHASVSFGHRGLTSLTRGVSAPCRWSRGGSRWWNHGCQWTPPGGSVVTELR